MATSVNPFLMFEGNADEAINLYLSLLPDSKIVSMVRHGDAAGDLAGRVLLATVSLAGQTVMFSDSTIKHAFTFTPAFSLFVTCESDVELAHLASALSDNGSVLMPLGDYGFSRQFAWVNDRFGVSWQLNLP